MFSIGQRYYLIYTRLVIYEEVEDNDYFERRWFSVLLFGKSVKGSREG